jgi:acid phosphatase type 7
MRFLRFILVAAVLLLRAGGQAAAPAEPVLSNGVTVAVTGDIAARGAKAVSDLIQGHPEVAAVLLAGDTANTVSTRLASYQGIYKGTYDRFLDKIRPAPGNHDRASSPPFSGYRTFWGESAHGPELYYSFDVGGWHVLSLDSVTYTKRGVAATNQLIWLQADLAAHPRQPVLAYWHYPMFSQAKHLGNAAVKPLWNTILAHGPALLMTGHNHVYERYGPLDGDGKPVPENQGIQEFVISPGGAGPVTKQSSKAKAPAPLKFHGGANHVGLFTLFPDGGYTFAIQAVDKKGVVATVDEGAGRLVGGAPGASGSGR